MATNNSINKSVPTGNIVGDTDTQTLTNKTITSPAISSITNSGTLTLPSGTDTLVGRATTDTLTNKTIDAGSNTITGVANANLSTTAGDIGGVWNAYTPTITGSTTNPNIGTTGTIAGRYTQIGKTVHFEVQISVSGSSISSGSGNYRVSLPVNAETTYTSGNSPKIIPGFVSNYNNSNTTIYLGIPYIPNTAYIQVYMTNATSTNLYTNTSTIWGSSNIPVATSNVITITGTYEAA